MIASVCIDFKPDEGRNAVASDREMRLMLRVRDDDGAAFEELMHRYQARLERLFRRRTGSQNGAEDFVQDVFLRVWQARRSYVPRSCFSTWLYTIAKHAASNALRSRSRQSEFTLRFRRHCSEACGDTRLETAGGHRHITPPRLALERELTDCVRRAVESLQPRQRRALLLKLDDLSYREMARRLRVSPDAVKSLLARSRADLRRRLRPYLLSGRHPQIKPRSSSTTSDLERIRCDLSVPVSC